MILGLFGRRGRWRRRRGIRPRPLGGAGSLAAATLGCLGLDLANGLFEGQPLARDFRFAQGRRGAAQLRHQGRARAFVECTPGLAGILVETGYGASDERIVVGHRSRLHG
jgi:hypothetical protein